jgi:tRNA (cytidine/uridine-2'-O-)-methyltransferase
VFAFTTAASTTHTEIEYRAGDVLLFGAEPMGLAQSVLDDPNITKRVRIPMLAGRRSLNLANAAAIASYELWRQLGFAGTEPRDG